MELKTYKKRVELVLEKFPSTRNCDKHLLAHYINTFHKDLVENKAVPLRNFRKLPSSESIRRARQIIQNDNGLYLPTDEKVVKGRGIKQKNWTEAEVRECKES